LFSFIISFISSFRYLSLFSRTGDQVNKNEPVVVLSAMKMEITIVAPQAGKIRAMHVKVGDSVTTAQLLFEVDFD
jgi:pyruvate carboxylase